MNVSTAILNRRSVRHFDADHRMTQEEIDTLLSLAVQSPTAFNIQNWRFVVVQDPELRRRIRKASWDQPQVTDASLLIILCADLKAWEREPMHYWRSAREQAREYLVPTIRDRYTGLDQMQRDEAMRSCGIAAQTLMLAAQSMGYESCPMDGFDFDAVSELIHLPENHAISLFVAIGKGTADESEVPRDRLPLEQLVRIDTF